MRRKGNMDIASYITGFVEGKGCFRVSFNLRNKLKTGIEIKPSFSLSQHQRNIKALEVVQSYFRCGGIRYSSKDRSYKYEVCRISDLQKIIIPHFKKYRLVSSRANDFDKFVMICDMVTKNYHRNNHYLVEIIELAYDINHDREKINKEKLLKHLAR